MLKDKPDIVLKAWADPETRRIAGVAELTKQLKEAEDKLRELLTVSQEAKLVVEGFLD